MFVLPVGFSVITNDPICISNWSTTSVCRGDFSMESIVQSLEKTVLQVHISDWVNAIWESDTSWHLTISVSPVVFNTFHVPLVYNNDNFLGFRFINFCKKVIISLVDKDSLEFWEENVQRLNIPVDEVRVKTFFTELSWLTVLHSRDGFGSFILPEGLSLHSNSSDDVTWEIHSSFMIKSLPSFLIELSSKEFKFGS
jgi:hypothetical protein